MTTMKDRVASGARLLDRYDSNWRKVTTHKNFDMNIPAYCVLGKVYGDYIVGLWYLRVAFDRNLDPIDYGFTLDTQNPTDFDALTSAWKEEAAR